MALLAHDIDKLALSRSRQKEIIARISHGASLSRRPAADADDQASLRGRGTTWVKTLRWRGARAIISVS
jgi:hypothetical protein